MFGSSREVEELRREFDRLRKSHLDLRDYCVKLTDDMNKWAQGISAQLETLNKEKKK